MCDRRFYKKDHIKRHHVRKHGHKEYEAPASYVCPLCQKSFHSGGHLRKHLKTHHPTITSSSPQTAPARLLNISFLKKSAGRPPQISFLRTYQCFLGSSDGLVTLERLEMLKSDSKALVEPAASMSSLRILQKLKP